MKLIDLLENIPKELDIIVYVIIVKKEKALNQQLDKQLKVGLIVKSSLKYAAPYFYIQRRMDFYNWYKIINS